MIIEAGSDEAALQAASERGVLVEKITALRDEPPARSAVTPVEVRDVNPGPMRVDLVDIDIPFWSLVLFLVKLSVAAIPASIILGLIFLVLSILFGGIFGALLR